MAVTFASIHHTVACHRHHRSNGDRLYLKGDVRHFRFSLRVAPSGLLTGVLVNVNVELLRGLTANESTVQQSSVS